MIDFLDDHEEFDARGGLGAVFAVTSSGRLLPRANRVADPKEELAYTTKLSETAAERLMTRFVPYSPASIFAVHRSESWKRACESYLELAPGSFAKGEPNALGEIF